MSVVPQFSLADNQRFLEQIGYLAVISVKGPFSGNAPTTAINGFGVRENASDVKVGDHAYTGNEWGKVSDVAATRITVQFVNGVKPAGVANADYVPLRTEVYPISLSTAVGGATEDNAWQKLASIGVVFTYPLVPNSGAITNVAIELDSFPPTIQQGGPATNLDFNVGGVTVQRNVDGINEGTPITANEIGYVSMPNLDFAGEEVSFIVSKEGYYTITIGPYVVAAP